MATYASAPRAAHNLAPQPLEAHQHRRVPPTKEMLPPPPPKSPAAKPKKVVLPDPPTVIRDNHRGVSFQRKNFLGEGGFARVYEVIDERGAHSAVKVVAKVNLQSKKSKTKLYAEIKLHRALKHPNIVLFADCFEDDEHVYMSMELCENGSLNDLLRRRKRYTEPETRFFVMQLIGACHYMHTHQVIHRDLKLGNIFLDRDMNVKVGDFGLAALIETPGDRKKTICGTPNYIAPEVLFDTANGHSFEVDTWSIGVILYTLLVGKPPFQTSDVKSIYDRIKHNNYEFPPNKPISPDSQSLITDVLTQDPRKRPSLHQIVDTDFFIKGIFPDCIPTSAHEYAPAFAGISRSQSRSNYARVRRAVLLDVEDTEIHAVDIIDSGSRLDAASAQQQQKQEREFHKAVQPGSPISALLKSAREPLLVAKSPLRGLPINGENREPVPPVPSNPLARKLAAVPPKPPSKLSSVTSTPFPELPKLDEEVEKPFRRTGSTAAALAEHIVSGGTKAVSGKFPTREPLQPLPTTLKEEQDEARRRYDLASQKARIVSQMAVVDEEGAVSGGRRTGKDREKERPERGPVAAGRGLADDETESIKPIRESKRSTKSKATNNSMQGPAKLQGYEDFAQTLNGAISAMDEGRVFRDPALDEALQGPDVYIQSWVDYCNKYGMGYALTNGCVGVHFNDSTTMVLSADKHHFEYLSSRRNGVAYVRKNYNTEEYPADLKTKVYLLKHFERYIMDRLLGETEYNWDDVDRKSDLVFVHKYLRMTNVLLFKLSHDVLQFNFFDHTKLILSHGGRHLIYFDKHNTRHSLSLAAVLENAIGAPALPEEKRRFNGKLVRKITFCKDLLHHILTYSGGSRVEADGAGAEHESNNYHAPNSQEPL